MKEIYNVLEDLFRRCLKKSNVFSFYFERYESKSLALKTPNQNTSIWVFLKQIMLVGKCRLLKLLCNLSIDTNIISSTSTSTCTYTDIDIEINVWSIDIEINVCRIPKFTCMFVYLCVALFVTSLQVTPMKLQ